MLAYYIVKCVILMPDGNLILLSKVTAQSSICLCQIHPASKVIVCSSKIDIHMSPGEGGSSCVVLS